MDVQITIAGGMQEVGARNGTAFTYKGKTILVDWGGKIPHQGQEELRQMRQDNGGDLPPDYYPRDDVLDGRDVRAVLITHGHEDHFKGWHRVERRFPGIAKLTDPFSGDVMNMRTDRSGRRALRDTLWYPKHFERVEIGETAVTRFPVHHSIPGASGYLLEAQGCRVAFLGDSKLWPAEEGGADHNYEVFKQVQKDGQIHVLFVDCTNIQRPGFVIPERDVASRLRSILDAEHGRVFLCGISSNIPRFGPAIDYALSQGRSVFAGGGSLQGMLRIAGIDKVQSVMSSRGGNIDGFGAKQLLNPWPSKWPDNSVIFVTGSQAEQYSFLDNLARRNFIIAPRPDDVFVQSQGVIPKPEILTRWPSMMEALSSRFARMHIPEDSPEFESLGAEVVRHEDIHASGHANRDEILQMIGYFWHPGLKVVFCHADLERRMAAAELARQRGVEAVLLEEGECLEI